MRREIAERDLPPEFVDRARMFGPRRPSPYWVAADAIAIIDWLRHRQRAVLGIEVFYDRGEALSIIATSTYDKGCDRGAGWTAFVQCCADGALAWMKSHEHIPDALFDLAWSSEDELPPPRRRAD